MIRFLFLVWVCVPTVAFAQVTVRTGDHPTFSRIVLTFPEGSSWSLDTGTNSAIIAFTDVSNVDLEGFFDRISRDRVLDAQTSGASVTLDLACRCDVTAFLWRPDKLVVDVSDAADDAEAQTQDESTDLALAPLPLFLPVEPQDNVGFFQGNLADATAPASDVVKSEDTDSAQIVAGLREKILDDLATVASQGIIASPEHELIDDAEGVPNRQAVSDFQVPGLQIRSGSDERRTGDSEAEQVPAYCLTEDWYAVADWGNEDPFSEQIAARRLALVADLDGSRKPDVDALARTYLFFGFGREAMQTLASDGYRDQARIAIRAIAQVIDEELVEMPMMDELTTCKTDIALWAFLAGGRSEMIDPTSILGAFRALPSGLRTHLGPRLSQAFLDAGLVEAAGLSLQSGNPMQENTVAGSLAEIEVLANEPVPDSNLIADQIDALSSEPARLSPETLLSLMQSNRRNGFAPDLALMDLAAGMRFEMQGTPLEALLAAEEALSAAISGDLDRAVDVRMAIEELPIDYLALDNDIARNALELGNDVAFLEFVSEDRSNIDDASVQNALAARLLRIGFADFATRYIAPPARGPDMMERRYLRAQAALELEQFDRIDAILAGMTTERATAIRAARDARLAGYNSEPVDENEAAQTAWRDGNWQELSASDDPLFATAADLQFTDTAQATANLDASLSTANQVLEDTSALREFIGDLSTRYTTPEDSF
ncbi:hypothetical protein [Yoonia sp. 208BN28-4]|uniref:hypothetical protein n=1 Tax=Yoonia sp. 208BN28-4 TaxID=3126505 RepID=UPI0030AF7ACE